MRDTPPRFLTLAVLGPMYFLLGASADVLYALLPALAAAYAVSTVVVVWLITARAIGKLVAPGLGVLSDRVGHKRAALLGLGLLGLGNLAAAASGSFAALLAAQVMAGLGMAALQVSLPAYLADVVPYRKRGRTMGLVLLCAPAGTIVGVPVGTFAAERVGLWLTFVLLAALAALLLPLAALTLAPSNAAAKSGPEAPAEESWLTPLREGRVRAAVAITLLWGLMSAGIFNFLSIWLEGTFALSTAEIGGVFSLVGAASLGGYALVASLSDRLGKRRAALAGMGCSALAAVLLSRAPTLVWAVAALVGYTLVNDAGFAALQVLVTEILPARRGAMMSFYLLSWGVAITTAPLVGGLLWDLGGFAALVLGMSLAGGLAFLLALRWLPRTVGAAPAQSAGEPVAETA